ncbi:MAG: TetR/AcrR family transcriptional regulator [Acidimicrobiia bacterium]
MAIPRPADEVTARARIRDAAFQLVAERGVQGATLRAIAEIAGVSSALVVHHYGSKQGVLDEVGAWVLEILDTAVDLVDDDTETANAERMEAYARLFLDVPHLAGYVRRMVLDDSDSGVLWFESMVDNTVQLLRRREALGKARRSSDVRAEALLLNVMGLGPILLPRHLMHIFGDTTMDVATQRWNKAASELFGSALYPASKRRAASRLG